MATVVAVRAPSIVVARRASCSRLSLAEQHVSCGSRHTRRVARLGTCCSLPSENKKGFGKAPKRKSVYVERKSEDNEGKRGPEFDRERREDEEPEDEVVPEIVTNRMLKRISLTVGFPLAVGVCFFPLFYYLKVIKKVDVPEWLPLLTSMLTFGVAGFGITYGVLSASWDPSREGSLLGWKEAQVNWPVFLETVQGKKEKK